jgi:non-heme Fe2+,alpha-ketoglutarate-dependent halogenase
MTAAGLTKDETTKYRQDGFLCPIPVFGPREVTFYLERLSILEAWMGRPASDRFYRAYAYTYLQWMDGLVRHPRILDIVESVLGPDILVFGSAFFIKEAFSETFADWHQDATYFGLKPNDALVTAWLALTDATLETGCMEVIPPADVWRQLRHEAKRQHGSINSAGQTITLPLNERDAVAMQLQAGSLSLHNGLTPHRSGPNRSRHRRVGVGIQYIPGNARPNALCSHRVPAMVVRGTCVSSHFDLISSQPKIDLGESELANHRKLFRQLYHKVFREQALMHNDVLAIET